MPRRACPELFDLVLDSQLASLQSPQFDIVYRRMEHGFVDFSFEIAMPALKFLKMGCK
jgi:hypothetical protein